MEDIIQLSEPLVFGKAFAITPADGSNLTRAAKGLYIGTAGALKVTTIHGDIVIFANVTAGFLPLAVKKVFANVTSATGIVGFF